MIDVHMAIRPDYNGAWLYACRQSLRDHPITLHEFVNPHNASEHYLRDMRLHGFALGRHPLVSFVDDDDIVLDGAFQACLDLMTRQPDLWACYTYEYYADHQAHFTEHSLHRRPHHLLVYRRDALQNYLDTIWDWRPGVTRYSEGVAPLKAMPPERVGCIPRGLYVWRRHEGSTLNRINAAAQVGSPY
jgi:hypothetical protein